MVVHGFHADIELAGDLLGAVAFGDELEDFAFSIGEKIGGGARGGVGHDVAQQGGNRRAEIGAAIGDGFQAFFKLEEAGGFFNKSVGARLKHLANQHWIFVP